MQTVTVKIDDTSLDFFIELVKNLNFAAEIQIMNSLEESVSEKIDSPFRLPEGKPLISDFAGFWADNPRTLEQIRKKAWKRT
ncbi:MAG: hypothetical protein B6I20_02880 [Bacteroidetes bacterium 4572_117]|nr:MAG: hypothetical protein B6I20_02880 [Bacteroidetes bacterium 4572_117]